MQFDLLLSFNTPQLIGLKVLAEFEMRSYAVVPAGHPISAKESTSLAECALALTNDPAVKEGILTRMEATAGFKPRVAVTTNSYAFMREVARYEEDLFA